MKKILATLLAPYWLFVFLMLCIGAFFVLFVMFISKGEFKKEDWLLVLNTPMEMTIELIYDFIEK